MANNEDELIIALADEDEEGRNLMECYIIENGAERKADMEDLFRLIADKDRTAIQYFLREANHSPVDLAAALAFLPAEMKEMVYSNVSPRIGGGLKKQASHVEAKYPKESVARVKAEFIDFIGKFEKERSWAKLLPEKIIWKETEPKKGRTVKPSPLESFVKQIERALLSGELDITYQTDGITQQDMENAFQEHLSDLHKIRRIDIQNKDLPTAALLFETGKIEGLFLSGAFDGAENDFAWPSFLDKCHTLTSLSIYGSGEFGLIEFPSWIRNAVSLRALAIENTKIKSLPDWVGDLQSLTMLSLYVNKNLETLPDSIGSLKSLDELYIRYSPIIRLPDSITNLKNLRRLGLNGLLMEKIPDWLGDLQSLTDLSLYGNKNLKTLPDSIGNLKNLVKLCLEFMPIEKLSGSMGNLKNLQTLSLERLFIKKIPDWLGDLQSLTELTLDHNGELKTLPDSIGKLKNLTKLDLSYSPIDELPDTIMNCTALESVDIFGTEINSVPDFIKSINNFNDNTVIETIPQKRSISYRCFCNSYYRLAETIIKFNDKARREGLLALEEGLDHLANDFFKQGIRMVVDGTDAEYIRDILQTKLERESDFYRKKLMETAMEGILGIQAGDSPRVIALMLASLVKIENNPLDIACTKYLSGDSDALTSIDFFSAIKPEEEREEISFIKHALEFSETARREGFLAMEGHLDHEKIAARDVFECGIVLVIDGWDAVDIARILDSLIAHETDAVQKNFSQAKKEAVLSINAGVNPRLLLIKLCAFFGESIEAELMNLYD